MFDLLIVSTLLPFVAAVFYIQWTYTHWRRRGMPYLEPKTPFGNLKIPFGNRTVEAQLEDVYHELKKRALGHCGLYLNFEAVYMIADLDYIRDLLTNHYFYEENHKNCQPSCPKCSMLKTNVAAIFTTLVGRLSNLVSEVERLAGTPIKFNELLEEYRKYSFFKLFDSFTTLMVLYELARNQHVQEKLREEINKLFDRDGRLTYNNLKELRYLEKVISEALRLHPKFRFMTKPLVQKYCIPNSDFVLERGTKLIIPIYGIHMDPEYYPLPEIFDPERFSRAYASKRPAISFIPFPDGRELNANHLDIVETKIGIVSLVRKIKLSVNRKTKLPVVWLDAEKL